MGLGGKRRCPGILYKSILSVQMLVRDKNSHDLYRLLPAGLMSFRRFVLSNIITAFQLS